MNFEIEKAGLKFIVSVGFKGLMLSFEGINLSLDSDFSEAGIKFRNKTGIEIVNKRLGINDSKKYITGIKLEKEHIEKINILKDTIKNQIELEVEKLINSINEKTLITINDFGTFIAYDFGFNEDVHYIVRDKAKEILIEKYNLSSINRKDLKKFKEVDFDYGDYSNTYTYKETIESLLNLNEEIKIEATKKEEEYQERKEMFRKQNHYYEFEVKVIEKDKDDYIKLQITEKETGVKRIYTCKNIFDFGYAVYNNIGFASEGDIFDKKVNKYLNAFPLISKEISM